MNRGSRRIPTGSLGQSKSFNEAPIHESGKFQRDGHRRHVIARLQ